MQPSCRAPATSRKRGAQAGLAILPAFARNANPEALLLNSTPLCKGEDLRTVLGHTDGVLDVTREFAVKRDHSPTVF